MSPSRNRSIGDFDVVHRQHAVECRAGHRQCRRVLALQQWRWPVEIGGSIRHVGQRFLFEDDLTAMLPYTTADLFAFVDIPGRDLPWQGLEKMRVSFRVRNVTNALYAQLSDPGLPDQVILGAPRTFELGGSAKW